MQNFFKKKLFLSDFFARFFNFQVSIWKFNLLFIYFDLNFWMIDRNLKIKKKKIIFILFLLFFYFFYFFFVLTFFNFFFSQKKNTKKKTQQSNKNTQDWGYPNDAYVKNCISGKCIKTNLAGSYHPYEFSYAETPSISFVGISPSSQIYLNFSAFIRFDGGQDGANIRYSTDNRNTWRTLGNATSGGIGWYNTASKHIFVV